MVVVVSGDVYVICVLKVMTMVAEQHISGCCCVHQSGSGEVMGRKDGGEMFCRWMEEASEICWRLIFYVCGVLKEVEKLSCWFCYGEFFC